MRRILAVIFVSACVALGAWGQTNPIIPPNTGMGGGKPAGFPVGALVGIWVSSDSFSPAQAATAQTTLNNTATLFNGRIDVWYGPGCSVPPGYTYIGEIITGIPTNPDTGLPDPNMGGATLANWIDNGGATVDIQNVTWMINPGAISAGLFAQQLTHEGGHTGTLGDCHANCGASSAMVLPVGTDSPTDYSTWDLNSAQLYYGGGGGDGGGDYCSEHICPLDY